MFMPPQNTNPDFNPSPNNNPQPGSPDNGSFQRRPVQQFAPRPHSVSGQQQFTPQPQPQTPQFPQQQPQPPRPQQPQQPQFHQPQQLPQRPAPQQTPQFSPNPVQPAQNNFAPNKPAFQPQQAPQYQPNLAPRQAPTPQSQNFNPAQSQAPTFSQPQPAFNDQIRSNFPKPLRKNVAERPNLPKGVFALLALGIAGLAVGIMDKSQHNVVFNAFLGINVILVITLMFVRRDMVRKASLGFALATITASAALVLSYWSLTGSTVNAEAAFVAEAKKLQNMSPTKQLTHEQQQHLDAMQLQLEAQQAAVGKNSTLVYGKYGTTVVLYGLAALYLSRSKVKKAFQEVENS